MRIEKHSKNNTPILTGRKALASSKYLFIININYYKRYYTSKICHKNS